MRREAEEEVLEHERKVAENEAAMKAQNSNTHGGKRFTTD